MPRGPRLDVPGTLHHVMFRGVNGKDIVLDDDDRRFFIARLGSIANVSGTPIYAWALMNNHAHLLLKSGAAGLSAFMRKLLTGYAVFFNQRHGFQGHVFQNRYKSIVCEERQYFLKLVSYIHLNPLRARLVSSLEELDRYPWCGHAVVMGYCRQNWQDRQAVLRHFGEREAESCNVYRNYLNSESGLGEQPELTGGGLLRSCGGWSEVKSKRKLGEQPFGDERILGSSEFVRRILDEEQGDLQGSLSVMKLEEKAERRLKEACDHAGISVNALQSGSRVKPCPTVRKELAVEFVRELGLSYAVTARLLGVSSSAIKQILLRLGLYT
ncbi:transposase [Prosthecochloris sp. N3]|uniref:Transposase n=1 Tax=Prosthecochloris ethylica TaxID=2743976 RepID=A0ABR9XRD3_9CHLB|nr:transposase [Prosthecochloris ethylica]MBF0586040.1 transposase [Prosthecochloris ethylica]MBF0636560.1 transposase [Prosthecochloris ethylica]NUK47192.1 transposase [Prosthecochloris ethylica]